MTEVNKHSSFTPAMQTSLHCMGNCSLLLHHHCNLISLQKPYQVNPLILVLAIPGHTLQREGLLYVCYEWNLMFPGRLCLACDCPAQLESWTGCDTPLVLVIETFLAWCTALPNGQTFCYPSTCIKDINTTILLQTWQHSSVTAVSVHGGTNDKEHQKLEKLQKVLCASWTVFLALKSK